MLVIPLALLPALPSIPQDLGYHAFADARTMLGIPNALNVLSNVPFLIVGLIGLAETLRRRDNGATPAWAIFFAGTALVAFGSGGYHWAPGNAPLVWDRLPMTIAFMALFAALVAEHVGPRAGNAVLPAAIAVGLVSIGWWMYADDLRLYGWVQFAPLLAIVLMMVIFPPRYSHRAYLGYGLAFYLAAKLAEHYDGAIYALTGDVVSGHTLKHLLAAGAPLYVWLMLRRRAPVSAFTFKSLGAKPRREPMTTKSR